MSKLETPLTRTYWHRIGGTLVEEFELVKKTRTCARRLVDAIILPDGDFKIARPNEVNLDGERVIVVQTKVTRLGMYLMGQALFSAELVRRFNPASVVSVALCSQDDDVLRPLLDPYPHLRVVVIPLAEVTASSM